MSFFRFLYVLIVWSISQSAYAHDPFASEIKAEATDSTLTFKITTARSVAAYCAGITTGPRHFYAHDRFAQDQKAFEQAFPLICVLEADGKVCESISKSVALIEDEEIDVVYTFTYARPASGKLKLSCPWLTKMPAMEEYKATLVMLENKKLIVGPNILTFGEPASTFAIPPLASVLGAADAPQPAVPYEAPKVDAFGFFKLGVEHILTGYDHLLYLAALILGCMSLRSIAGIVTAFTLSHSLTLALATLGWVRPPSAIVEQVIAASIVFVAVENLWMTKRRDRLRQGIAFSFGLIHGFGFAGLLADLGVGQNGGAVVVPLLTFNLGVEAGQLLVIACTLPLLLLARRSTQFVKYGQPAASICVAAMGCYWLVTRL